MRKIPKDIALNIRLDDGTVVTWSFARCVRWLVDSCQRFNVSGPGIRQGMRILAAIEDKNADDDFELKPEDDKALHDAFETPDAGYCPPLAQQIAGRLFFPYIDALSAESTEKKAA